MEKKRHTHFPELPLELWLTIVDLASWLPNVLDPDLRRIRASDTSPRTKYTSLRESIRTKLNLSQVCKRFHTICVPHLYKSILIRRSRSLLSLSATLIASEQRSATSGPGNHGRPYGWWAKRLDVAIRDAGSVNFDRLVEIVRCLPNLEVVIFFMNDPQFNRRYTPSIMPNSVLHALADTSGSSLRVISWMNDCILPLIPNMITLLSATPNLRAIRCPEPLFGASVGLTPPAMPNLTTIVLSNKVGKCLDTKAHSLPSLRELVIDSRDLNTQRPFLAIHGRRITSLTLHGVSTEPDVRYGISTIAEHCPSLTRLDVCFPTWMLFPTALAIPPGVTHLGVGSGTMRPPRPLEKFRRLFAALRTLVFVDLETVQFLEPRNVVEMAGRHPGLLREEIGKLNARGLRVEDHNGCLLSYA